MILFGAHCCLRSYKLECLIIDALILYHSDQDGGLMNSIIPYIYKLLNVT